MILLPVSFDYLGVITNCNDTFLVWSTWSRFGDCSVTCNGGVKTRTRTCENGSVGEKGCEGSTNMTMVRMSLFWTENECVDEFSEHVCKKT